MKARHYNFEEVKNIFADREAGMSLTHLKEKYSRPIGGLRSLFFNYGQFQKGKKNYLSDNIIILYKAIADGNNHKTAEADRYLESVSGETDTLIRLETAFNRFQEVMVEVIEEEVKKRSESWVKRAVDAEAELAKYKDAAQQSSMIGTLRKHWGLGS